MVKLVYSFLVVKYNFYIVREKGTFSAAYFLFIIIILKLNHFKMGNISSTLSQAAAYNTRPMNAATYQIYYSLRSYYLLARHDGGDLPLQSWPVDPGTIVTPITIVVAVVKQNDCNRIRKQAVI